MAEATIASRSKASTFPAAVRFAMFAPPRVPPSDPGGDRIKPEWPADSFDHLEADGRQSIARIKASPFIPHKKPVQRFVYDLEA
jgi:hypothetical protein